MADDLKPHPSFDTSTTSRLVVKFALLFSSVTFLAIITSGFFHYQKNIELILMNLQNQLQLAANTIAISIDGDAYQTLEGKASLDTPAYRQIRAVLSEFYHSNRQLGFESDCIYTFRRISGDSLEFTVMLHDQYVGNRYAIRPEMLPTIDKGKTSFTGIYEDENGTWVSAYAAILNRNGEVVGLVEVDFKDNVYLAAVRDEIYSILFFSLAGMGLAIIAAVLLSRLISRPIGDIAAAAVRFSGGDLDTQVPVKGRDEIGMLARAFNYMVQEIKDKELIRSRNKALREAYTQLDALNHSLQEANRLKSEFLGIAAHDLKNQLQAIMGFSEMMLSIPDQHPDVQRNAEKILTAARRMLSLINQLLDRNAIEAGAVVLQQEMADIGLLARQVVQQNDGLARRKQQRIVCSAESGCMARVDVNRMYEVIDNLLSNAIKFSPPGTTVLLDVRRVDDDAGNGRVRLSVRDDGPGLSQADMAQLFNRFVRLSARPTGGESSTGLGLSVVKQWVELLGGKVWAESEGLGKGSTFYVEI